MEINVPPGKYVLAVSGGVDSMVLLDLLRKLHKVEIIVAHFNHGIRADAGQDERLVRETARNLGLNVEIEHGKLGSRASEDTARTARYKFLREVKKRYKADAIITAHHQDDLIETAIINLLRGTGRKGLSAIAQNPEVIRPLLAYPKSEIIKYAKTHGINWREDETNKNPKYLRNYVRAELLPKMTKQARQNLLQNLNQLYLLNKTIDKGLDAVSKGVVQDNSIKRDAFIQLPHEIGRELLMAWLRKNDIRDFDRLTIERLTTVIKTAKAGTNHEVNKRIKLTLDAQKASLKL